MRRLFVGIYLKHIAWYKVSNLHFKFTQLIYDLCFKLTEKRITNKLKWRGKCKARLTEETRTTSQVENCVQ